MYATFNNRFEMNESYDGKRRIRYKHNLRCNLKMFIEKSKPHTNPALPMPDKDWEIVMESESQAIIDEFKEKLAKDLTLYLKRRVKRLPTELAYNELERLARVRSVN